VPLFEYECRVCSARFEKLVFDRGEEVACRSCGSTNIAQLISTFAVSGTSDRSAAEHGPCGACGAAQRGMCGME
jgi:putative FmdB family regulatory protein